MRHEIRTMSAGFHLDRRWRAACSCGWISPRDFSSSAAAERDGDDHVLVAIGTES